LDELSGWIDAKRFQATKSEADNNPMLPFVIGYSSGSRTASRAASLARSIAAADGTHHTNRIEDLNERIDAMALIIRGMWSLLEESGYTADQLLDKMEEIDLADGTADGQVTPRPIDCRSCGSKVAPGLDKCQFCGTPVAGGDPPHPLGEI
jgi:hypothetical protein